jgi:hypothetical protein
MRFFTVVDFQYITMGFILGLVGLALVCLAWGTYPRRGKTGLEEDSKAPEGLELLTGHHAAEGPPIVPFLVTVFTCAVIWSVTYMIVVGIRGPSF